MRWDEMRWDELRQDVMRSEFLQNSVTSSRSGHSSQGARRRQTHAQQAHEPLTYQEVYNYTYAIVHGTASEFNGTWGYSSEDDTCGTRSKVSGLRTSLRQARDRLQSRDDLVEDVVARLRTTRDPLRKDASANPQGYGRHSKATAALFMKPLTPNHADSRRDIPTPKQSPVSRSCDLTYEMPSSVESGAVPGNSTSRATKRRVEFAIDDGGSDASGSKSKGGSGTKRTKREECCKQQALLELEKQASKKVTRKRVGQERAATAHIWSCRIGA